MMSHGQQRVPLQLAAEARDVIGLMQLAFARPRRALAQAGCAVNLTPSARATFITVSNRGFAPGASAL